MRFDKLYEMLNESENYEPPWNLDVLKLNYPNSLNDLVHKWRAETGI